MQGSNVNLRDLAKGAFRSCGPLTPGQQRMLRAGYRALVEGAPLSVSRLGQLADLTTAEVEEVFTSLPGFARLDAEGRVVGLLGLSAHCSTHRFDAVGRTVSTWCAWDSLFIPRVIGMQARVASHCPITAALIRLVVTPTGVLEATPAGVTVSFLLGHEPVGTTGIAGACCPEIHFLSSDLSADRWLALHPDGAVLTLDEAWEVGRIFVDEVLFPDREGSRPENSHHLRK
jgi:alkylmercury lyase